MAPCCIIICTAQGLEHSTPSDRGRSGGAGLDPQAGEHQVTGDGFTFSPIGFVENAFVETRSDPDMFRGTSSRIRVLPEFERGLFGIEGYERLYVIFAFHASDGYSLLVHPRGDTSRPRRGVFATHSPRRPNAIGLSVVELVSVDGQVLTVRDLDAIDGTPVLDIKPCEA